MRKLSLMLAFVTLLPLTTLHAASAVDGLWDFTMTSPMGSVSAKVTLKVDGGTLTGQFDLGNGRTWPIQDGVVDGNGIRFTITRDGASMTYAMRGTVEGDAVAGAAEAMGSVAEWSMVRAK
ncbi:MAG: hypothetical protein RLZZ385_874 [Pseudomonadota bacterium]|jgi:hypothetical protein